MINSDVVLFCRHFHKGRWKLSMTLRWQEHHSELKYWYRQQVIWLGRHTTINGGLWIQIHGVQIRLGTCTCNTHTHTRTRTRTRTHTCTHTHTYTHTCTHTHWHKYTPHTHAHTHTYTHTYTHTHTHTNMCACTHTHTHMRVYTHTHACTHARTHTHTHTNLQMTTVMLVLQSCYFIEVAHWRKVKRHHRDTTILVTDIWFLHLPISPRLLSTQLHFRQSMESASTQGMVAGFLWGVSSSLRMFSSQTCHSEHRRTVCQAERIGSSCWCFNYHWQDGTYRDIVPVQEKYSDEQQNFFRASREDRAAMIREIRSQPPQWLDSLVPIEV